MEERLIGATLAGIPAYVDSVHVVDDASIDGTAQAALRAGDARLRLRRHAVNSGVGAAIITGYRSALAEGADVLAVMAGDNQMHPDDLAAVIKPVISGSADYAKGNRFIHPAARHMPMPRRIAGRALSAITRAATGYAVDDSQCGFTALSARAAYGLDLDQLWPRFGYPNDLLGMLAGRGLRVVDVPVRPVYAGENSGVRPWHVASITGLIVRRWWRERGAELVKVLLEPGPSQARKARSTSSSL
jgi:glycosyltransferase involved in cell wall biosynthesis